MTYCLKDGPGLLPVLATQPQVANPNPILPTIHFTNPMKKLLFPALLTISAGLAIASPNKAYSQLMDACDRSYTIGEQTKTLAQLTDREFAQNNQNGCAMTPEKYEIVIYEMGLCTGSNPISGGTLDRTNCTATFTNSSGQTVDLAGSNSVTLDASNSSKPSPDTYTWGYMVMANTFGLIGSFKTADSTWMSTAGAIASSARTRSVEFTDTLTDFGSGNSCESSANATMSLGTMYAIVTDSDLNEDTTCSSNVITRLVGAFSPSSSYTISESTTAVKITFTVTDNGMSVIPDLFQGGARMFASGPFQMEITTIEQIQLQL